jgi:FixJ family two-component response regulator/anti-sigma regulatory factor (Ser/Thr protein kinase)
MSRDKTSKPATGELLFSRGGMVAAPAPSARDAPAQIQIASKRASQAPPTSPLARHHILVVEDDPTSRTLLQIALAKAGWIVRAVENAADAREILTTEDIGAFDCVVTDYRMPGATGLDLLAWIKEREPCLAGIIVTAEGERGLITESLRGGAVDFLDKPVDFPQLYAAVKRAVQHTSRQRQLTASESDIADVGRAQKWLLGVEAARSPVGMDICFHPKHEAGGDFFSCFQPAPNQVVCLITDVSGHDLKAAYNSAYFQGIVRGMFEQGAPVEEVFAACNRLLLEQADPMGSGAGRGAGMGASVAAGAIIIDSVAQTATVLAHGLPAPVYWLPDGNAQTAGLTGGFPLGWFEAFSAQPVMQPISENNSFCFWTDGLDEVAERTGVSNLSLACALLQAKRRNQRLAEIDFAADDILVVDLNLSPEHDPRETFRPLLLEEYHGGQHTEIDRLQGLWQRSLVLAVRDLPEATLHDILLCSRESVLNALRHGCRCRKDQLVSFQAAYCEARRTIRVRVCDPGPGHHFDPARAELQSSPGLAEAHRGLILIKHLSTRTEEARNGASVLMDFAWP